MRAREVYISRGLLSEAWRHNVRERNQLTDCDQIELSPFCCHCWGGGEGEGEKDVSRVCAVGIEAQLASVCVCVCLFERGVDRLLSRSRCRPTPSVSGSVCVCLREKPVDRLVSRSRCHPTPSVLGSVCVCGCVGVGVCVGGRGCSDTYISLLL